MAFVNLKDAIIDHLNTIITNNTQGVAFDIGVDIKQAQERYAKMTTKAYSPDELIEYVPGMFDVEDSPTGNPKVDKTIWTIGLTLSMSATDDNDAEFFKEKAAIEELRKELRSNPKETFDVDGEIYTAYFKPTYLSRVGSLEDQDGYIRPQMVMAIAAQSGIGLAFGDVDEKIELAKDTGTANDFIYTELYTNSSEESTAVEYNTSHPDNENVAKGVPNRAIWQMIMDVEYNGSLLAHRFLLSACKNQTEFDTQLFMKITNPDTSSYVKIVNVQGTRQTAPGETIVMSLKFTEVEYDA